MSGVLPGDAGSVSPAGGVRPRFSFEVFPARSGAAALALGSSVQFLQAAGPDFIAVTYGALGSNRDASFDLLRYLRKFTSALPLAHLTTVGETRDGLKATLHALMDDGIHDFLALRGDLPRSERDGAAGGVECGRVRLSSVELVELISEVRAERPPFSSVGRTAVACYPNGHAESVSPEADVEWLLRKQQAGASLAITQLFFYADQYLGFVERARRAGVSMQILPGLMPVSTSAQLRRVASLAGQPAPVELERELERAGGYAPELGVSYTADLARELLAGGAPSIHLYTFNRHEQVLRVCRELGLI